MSRSLSMKKLPLLKGLLGTLWVAVLVACGVDTSVDESSSVDELYVPHPSTERTVTDATIAVGNLDAQVIGMVDLLRLGTQTQEIRNRLFDLMLLRVQLLGRLSDLFAMQDLVDWDSGEIEDLTLAARFHMAVHEFDAAARLLVRIEEACQGEPSTDGCATAWQHRRTLDLARHERLSFWLETSREEVDRSPSFTAFFALAAVQGSLGMFEDADRSFASAVAKYQDVSPFPLASVAFRRGVMWSESAARPDLGDRFYREALGYLPTYVTANVHLAELVSSDDPNLARRLLESAADFEDPEPWGKLGGLLAESDAVSAGTYERRAAEAYRGLLDAFPLAFADHAAEFFAGPGDDPELSVDLALLNLDNRRTPRAYLVALGALEARGDLPALCEMVAEAEPYSRYNPVLRAEIDRLRSEICGRL